MPSVPGRFDDTRSMPSTTGRSDDTRSMPSTTGRFDDTLSHLDDRPVRLSDLPM